MITTIETSSIWNGGEITKDMYTEIQQAMVKSAEQIASKARQLVPKDTRQLESSIRAKGRRKKSGIEILASQLARGDYETALPGAWVFAGDRHKDVYWAHWVEYGTYNAPAHPFMRPAMDSSFNDVLAEAARSGQRAINNRRRQRKAARKARG